MNHNKQPQTTDTFLTVYNFPTHDMYDVDLQTNFTSHE